MTRRRRQRQEEEAENHERWLVSYADFITLLFAFFVVMYAISSVNEGKYRVLSDSIVSAFRNVPGSSAGAEVEIAPTSAKLVLPMIVPNRPAFIHRANSNAETAADSPTASDDNLRDVASEIREALASLIASKQVQVSEGERGITIDINASILFASAEAQLSDEAQAPLVAVARILGETDFPIIVEGHTDNLPIATAQFASNWELSGVRAASVVRLMIAHGVAAQRLTAVGHADQRPLAENDTIEGRARNRRVAITIESAPPQASSVPTAGSAVR